MGNMRREWEEMRQTIADSKKYNIAHKPPGLLHQETQRGLEADQAIG